MRYWQAVAALLFALPVSAELIVAGFNGQLLRYDEKTGASTGIFATLPGGPATPGPTGIAFGNDGNMYVSDWNHDVVLRFNTSTGAFVDTFTAFENPQDLIFGPDGNLYVTGFNTGIHSYDPATGALVRSFGLEGRFGVGPEELAFQWDGSLFGVDRLNGIRRYDSTTGVLLGGVLGLGQADYYSQVEFGQDGAMYLVGRRSTGQFQILRYFGFQDGWTYVDTVASCEGLINGVTFDEHNNLYFTTNGCGQGTGGGSGVYRRSAKSLAGLDGTGVTLLVDSGFDAFGDDLKVVSGVPEPGSALLVGSSLALLVWFRRRP